MTTSSRMIKGVQNFIASASACLMRSAASAFACVRRSPARALARLRGSHKLSVTAYKLCDSHFWGVGGPRFDAGHAHPCGLALARALAQRRPTCIYYETVWHGFEPRERCNVPIFAHLGARLCTTLC